MNKHYFRARMYLVAAVANVALTILFAVQYGMIGAAVATGVTMIVTSGIVMNVYYAKGIGLDMGLYWRQTLRFMVPVLPLCAAGVFAWNAIAASVQVGWLVLIAGILGYTAVYAAVVLLLSSNEYERGLIRSLLSKIRRGV
jgi:O-antigen/teichoic acid export membrane protein